MFKVLKDSNNLMGSANRAKVSLGERIKLKFKEGGTYQTTIGDLIANESQFINMQVQDFDDDQEVVIFYMK